MYCLRTLGPDKVRSPSQARKVPVGFVSDFLLYAVCAPHVILVVIARFLLQKQSVQKTQALHTHETDEA